MNLQDLNSLLDYNYWVRDRLYEALDTLTAEQARRDLGGSFGSIHDTVAHLYAAEIVWYLRWRGDSPRSLITGDAFADLAAVRAAWLGHERKMRDFVNELGEAGIARSFEYTMFNGQPTASPFWQMLQHVVNHGSYHRGQITTKLRQLGAQPAKSLDLIAFYREQGLGAGAWLSQRRP
jgi:uncharacterized damage-inducible protein DinB